ncbi:UNVERIFIED_CONTAM: hypothetical protein PYX00_000932 [Menopon gallinae]|uniref:Uncharacterized protein n=1 Tax=Menopon gallinae TaxID=328185 RepID=A0AAW2IAZ1_9NEOP
MKFQVIIVILSSIIANEGFIVKRSIKDESVSDYLTERICWWNEVCKEEFQTLFRCKCPAWSFCRSPGKYYNAFCSVAETGYIWNQPAINWGMSVDGV